MTVMLTRGLATAVLATLPLQYTDPIKYPQAGFIFQRLTPYYVNLAVVIILATAIIATVGVPILRWRAKK
jgi:hypothetical protein